MVRPVVKIVMTTQEGDDQDGHAELEESAHGFRHAFDSNGPAGLCHVVDGDEEVPASAMALK